MAGDALDLHDKVGTVRESEGYRARDAPCESYSLRNASALPSGLFYRAANRLQDIWGG